MKPSRRKPRPLAFLIAVPLLIGSCTTIPNQDAGRLSDARKAYDSIVVDMTESEVIEALGPPTTSDGNRLEWVTKFSPSNYESLEVLFDENGKIEKALRKRRYRSGKVFGYDKTESFSRSYHD